jgi:hypothetical protein
MFRWSTLFVAACVLLVFVGSLELSLRKSGPRRHLALTIIGITNGPAGAKLVTLRLLNDGHRAAQVLPCYGVEAQPPKVDASMVGSFSGGVRTLRPGDAWTNTISLPSLGDSGRSWRVGFSYWEWRSPLNQLGHSLLMQARLAKRDEEGFVAYTDWVTSRPGSQPEGAANRSQPVRVDSNRVSAAAGSGR